MSIEKIKQLEADIQQAAKDWQTELARLDAARVKATEAWTKQTTKLQQDRDALALAIKLQDFPKKLIKSYKTCSVCGLEMRPFKTADAEGNVKKYWACQSGDPTHDVIQVE